MVLPNFVFAGAPKSGSSTLFEYIKQHPDICMSQVKEPFFFDFNYDKGAQYYESLFKHHAKEKIVGEATVWYMSWPVVPSRMSELIPDAKLLFVLRNPIERAFSDYMMNLRAGHYLPKQTFGYVIRNEKKVAGLDRRIVSGGFYYRHLKRFEKYFSRKQMLIIPYQNLKQDLRAVERSVYDFLEISSDFQGQVPKNYMVAPYLSNGKSIAKISEKFILFNRLWKRSRHFRNLFLDFSSKRRNSMDVADHEYLRCVYSEENSRLEKYLDIDLSAWSCS